MSGVNFKEQDSFLVCNKWLIIGKSLLLKGSFFFGLVVFYSLCKIFIF